LYDSGLYPYYLSCYGTTRYIAGQYSNPNYGIINFGIPGGWYASENMFGDKGISVSMHPGTSDELLQRLTTGQVNETTPVMNLAVVDKAECNLEHKMRLLRPSQCSVQSCDLIE
jgi:hypothetical protein